tara:strand:- start:1282 stop:2682 length:1401 start_codon:yes stop_codon:yes gene_type:complete
MAEKLRPYIPSPRPVTGDGFPYYVDTELRKLATYTEQSKKMLELTEQALTGESASLLSVASAQVADGESVATQITQLESSVNTATATANTANNTANTATTNLANLTTSHNTLSTTVSAQATDITNLSSSVTTNTSDIATNTSDIATANTNVTNLTSSLNTTNTTVTQLNSDVSALSSSVTSLTTTVNGFSSSISTNTTSINGIESKYAVKINNNGHVSGFGLISTANNATPTSEFTVQADKFKIIDSSGSGLTAPFVVTGGVVYLDEARINTLSANKLNVSGFNFSTFGGQLSIRSGGVDTNELDTNAVETAKVAVDNITETAYAFSDSGTGYNYYTPYIQPNSFDVVVHAPCTIIMYAIMDFQGTIGSGTYARFGQWLVPNASSLYSFTTLPSGGSGWTNASPQQWVETTGYGSASHQQLVAHLDLTNASSSIFPYTVKQKVSGYKLNWTGFRMVTNHVAIVSYR